MARTAPLVAGLLALALLAAAGPLVLGQRTTGKCVHRYCFSTDVPEAIWALANDTCAMEFIGLINGTTNATLAINVYTNGGPREVGSPVYLPLQTWVEQAYPGRFFYDLQFPGFRGNTQPSTISTRVADALQEPIPPVRLFRALHFVLWEAKGKLFMDMWDLAYSALMSGRFDAATKIRRATTAIDSAWAIWTGKPDTCPLEHMTEVLNTNIPFMNVNASGENIVEVRMAAGHTRAAAAIRNLDIGAFNRSRAAMLSGYLEFGLQYVLRNSWTYQFAQQCHATPDPTFGLPLPLVERLTTVAMRDVLPMVLSLSRGLGTPRDKIVALSDAVFRNNPSYRQVSQAIYEFAKATPGVSTYAVGEPLPSAISKAWSVFNISDCRVNGGTIPNCCWQGRQPCTCRDYMH